MTPMLSVFILFLEIMYFVILIYNFLFSFYIQHTKYPRNNDPNRSILRFTGIGLAGTYVNWFANSNHIKRAVSDKVCYLHSK